MFTIANAYFLHEEDANGAWKYASFDLKREDHGDMLIIPASMPRGQI